MIKKFFVKLSVPIVVVVLMIAILGAVLMQLGWRMGNVVSGSMEPTVGVGSMILTRPASVSDIEEGDIIAFKSDDKTDSMVIHRVVDITYIDKVAQFRTKGDANIHEDRQLVPAESVEGRVILCVPRAGRVVTFLGTPQGIGMMLAVPVVLLTYGLFRNGKRNSREEKVIE